MKALMKRRKSPRVRIVMGSVRMIRTGRTTRRKSDRTMATKIAAPYPVMVMPGSHKASRKIITAVRSKRSSSNIIAGFSLVRSEERRVGKECRSGWWGEKRKKRGRERGEEKGAVGTGRCGHRDRS